QDLPAEVHQQFEEGIRSAATTVGNLHLAEGNIPQAWGYFRMLGATEPVRQALDTYQPKEEEDVHPVIDIAFHQGINPQNGCDWLFADDCYHIDISHLNSVVQMSAQLPPCDELKLARELCAYGKKLSPRFNFNADPPFENQYADYDAYLSVLTGEDVAGGLAHF